jgi:hypothetical protein
MTGQIDRQRLLELRNQALLYVYEHGATQPIGVVPLTNLKAALKITDEEWKQLYLLLRKEGLGETDGMNAHIYLTQHGRAEAERLLTA